MRITAIVAKSGHLIYGVYAWLALLAHSSALAVALVVLPKLPQRRRAARLAARMFFASIGSPVRTVGPEPPHGTCIIVANHASYLDGILLTAALPPRFSFLIKHEMARVPLAGFILRRLGSKFVNRGDARHRRHTARDLVTSATRGEALALFPEGTFAAAPGLRAFQSGAFGAAWRSGVPVIPVVILGTRRKLPSGALLPAPGALRVYTGLPLASDRFRSAKDLMHATRAALLEFLPEPDLAAERADRAERADTERADRADRSAPSGSRRDGDTALSATPLLTDPVRTAAASGDASGD